MAAAQAEECDFGGQGRLLVREMASSKSSCVASTKFGLIEHLHEAAGYESSCVASTKFDVIREIASVDAVVEVESMVPLAALRMCWIGGV